MNPSCFRRQQGMTLIGWIFVLGLLAFFTLITLKLLPIYLEHYSARTALESLKNEPFITKKSTKEMRTLLSRRFDINEVRRVNQKTAITITRGGGKIDLVLDYEIRTPLFGNLDVISHFHDELQLIRN